VQQQEMPQLPLPVTPPTQQQTASLPAPPTAAPPAPSISPDYRTLLSGWLESHKRYPEDARQRGEEGRAVLRFRVDRYGRVLDYQVVSSTGYGDLDQAIENMMRGATMPPFPPSMTAPEIEVSVTIRFGLSR
jgi:protein TonB